MTILREVFSILGPIISLGGLILLSLGLSVGDAGGMLSGAFLIPLGVLVYRFSKYIDGEDEKIGREEEDKEGRL